MSDTVQAIETRAAALSSRLRELFPAGALAAELCGSADPAALYPEEARHVQKAVPRRAAEFAAGRLCARLLLAELGLTRFALEVGAHRQPLWPAKVVGSITHTTGFCAAVAARAPGLRALGIDSEIAGSVKTELWRGICTHAEASWLRSLPKDEQRAAATLIFSAKEAFYKCQFALTQEHLGFHDVSIELPAWGGGRRGAFQVRANRGIRLGSAGALQGQYLFHEEFITTGMALG